MKEVWHMIAMEEHEKMEKGKSHSVSKAITMIVFMNLVFSFDSILSAIALSDVFWVMAAAIVVGGILMIWLADRVTNFLKKNRMYEVLGLFVLFLVGVMLMSEGGHLAHIEMKGHPVHPMSKATFYFVIIILILIDVVQGQYQKKLMKIKMRKKEAQDN
jgi:predicted tellurium resistance membrane protein TerC